MPAEPHLRSIRRWLLTAVFTLGVGVVAVARTGYVVTDYQFGLLFGLAGVAGGGVALAAGLTLLGNLLEPSDSEN